MTDPGLPIPRSLRILPLILLAAVAAQASTRGPDLSKYPLRIHVLISNSGSSSPNITLSSGGPIGIDSDTGFSDPGEIDSGVSGGWFQGLYTEYYGAGWADLVSPPVTTQALRFTYDHCDSRVHVGTGFQSLSARWKKQGKQLEVLVPTEAIPGKNHTHPFDKCTFNVAMHDGVYLMMRNGKLIQVSQQDYAKKPALRAYISAPTSALEPRPTALPTQ
jgi:hypothetical protein